MKGFSWTWLFESHHPTARRLRWGGLGIGLGISVFWLIVLGASFTDAGNLYLKDSLQEYLAIRAVLDGLSPYRPLPELAARYVPAWTGPVLPHPTPHPPPAILLAMPLGLGSFELLAWLWLCIEAGMGLVWIWLMARWWLGEARVRPWQVGLTALLWLAWSPVAQDLIYEQWMIPLLLLVTLAWMSRRAHKPVWSGVFLGLALSIKPIFWPLMLVLLWRRAWKESLVAGLTLGVLWGLSALVMGPTVVGDYFRAGAMVAPYYRGFAFNFSVLTLGYRLFEGTGSSALVSLTAPPLMHAPEFAPYASALAGVLVLVLVVWYQCHVDEDGAFTVGLAGSVVLSPVVWRHYFVLMALPLVLTSWRLKCEGWRGGKTALFLLGVLGLGMPDVLFQQFVFNFIGRMNAIIPLMFTFLIWSLFVIITGLYISTGD